MVFSRTGRAAAALLAVAMLALSGTAAAQPESPETSAAGNNPVYFVHGYNPGSDANCKTIWGNAVDYFEKRGWPGGQLKTVGYYKGDTGCDVSISDDNTTGTRIKHVAADFANYIYEHHTKKGKSVDIVAHSMGGLVTRVALLGSAKGWSGFPKGPLKVGDVVTLGTPHRGVRNPDASDTTQWKSMDPDSEFMRVLHAPENRLSQSWAAGTDWTFAGANEDETVSGTSAIDKGYHADHKFRYLNGNSPKVTHSGIREIAGGKHELRYWHSSEGVPHDTGNGWAPVKTAYEAVNQNGKW
ncbi:esterase/lipase family protein [Saccharopolyspora elongata]|uniref:GPI inositol-deacylase PGAP1-like alpha/beta domain-containing protein n=1 Tax=Saccharopolyspora elongata TaxID=2530387 RepID=A0A4R4ZAW3_9PSEU|nr:hypothetical protein [Saccharopolyspora elongata]TDD55488.1 hypothetical protein E1288_03300 [Saccharopolyspora elongata]